MNLVDFIEISYLFYRVCICCLKLCTTACLLYLSITVGSGVYLISLVLGFIDSLENPVIVSSRKLVKKYFRMMFWNKVYRRYIYDDAAVRRGDTYIYRVVNDICENKLEEFEPYVLENSSVGFHKNVMFLNVSGEAKLYDGHIKGLSTLHRAKHCSLQEEGRKLRVRADLGVGELEVHYKGSVKFMNFGPTIIVTCTLSYIQVFMEFKVNSRTGRDGRLTKFAIDDMRGMKIRISGLGPLNWAVNYIISGVTKIFIRFVQNIIEDNVEKHIREHISSYQFPVRDETIYIEDNLPIVTTFPETEELGSISETDSESEVHENISETEELGSTSETDSEIEIPEGVSSTEELEMTPEPASETVAPKRAPEPASETVAPKRALEPASDALAPKRALEPASDALAPKRAPESTPETAEPKETAGFTSKPEAPKRAPEPAPELSTPKRTLGSAPDTAVPKSTPGSSPETLALKKTIKPELETVDSEESSESELETEDSDEISEPEDGTVYSEDTSELELVIVDSEESP